MSGQPALPSVQAAQRPALSLVKPRSSAHSDRAVADVSPRLLTCFIAVAEELHFGRAADRLYVAQPALSRSIQQLERIIGRRLFVRTTRTVELTADAELLLPAAREVLEALSALVREVGGAHRTLRVAHLPGSDTTATILDHLMRSSPALELEEHAMSSAQQLAAVRDAVLDVAVCRAPARVDSDLETRLVRLDPLLVAVIGREPSIDRPVDVRHRTVAAADGGPHDPDYAAFLAAYERTVGCSFRRVGVPVGMGLEAYAMRRAKALAFVTLASEGIRLDSPCPTFGALPVQGFFPWSVVWRRGSRSPAVRAFLSAADAVAAARGWQDVARFPGQPWVPHDDFTANVTPWTLTA